MQAECLRRMTAEQRLQLMEDLTAVTVQLSRETIAAQMPGASRGEVMLRWIALVYGEDLAARVAPLVDRLGVEPSP